MKLLCVAESPLVETTAKSAEIERFSVSHSETFTKVAIRMIRRLKRHSGIEGLEGLGAMNAHLILTVVPGTRFQRRDMPKLGRHLAIKMVDSMSSLA